VNDATLERRLVQHILRTLERLQRLTRVPPEMVAETIFPHVRLDQIVEASLYLEKVARCINKQMQQMQWKCAECGHEVWFKDDLLRQSREIKRVRRDAHYCSPACRQKAFRKRKRVTASPLSALDKPLPRDNSGAVSDRLAVTPVAPPDDGIPEYLRRVAL
jgi:DNA-directed RNA polymerase subunit RPC12/RpoP